MEDLPDEGPDQVIATSCFTTTSIFCPVRIRYTETDSSRWTPMSLPTLMETVVKEIPNRVALAYKSDPEDKNFEIITFAEYLVQTKTAAKAFLKLGLSRLHSVAIVGFNSPEWFISYSGCIFAGGVACGVYTTNTPEATFYCLEKGLANVAVVEDDEQAQKILRFRLRLPKLKAVIQYRGEPTAPGVLSWEEFMSIGNNESDVALQDALKKIAINECCTIIYTSGTTGPPKGVMLTHDNLIWNARSAWSVLKAEEVTEKIISYLPLSHVAALMMDVYCQLVGRISVYFANKDALKGGLVKTLVEVKPTRFLGVPRVWEKIADRIKEVSEELGFVKKAVSSWAKSYALQRHTDLMEGKDSPTIGYLLARGLVFSKLKSKLGFDNCKTYWSGAAPLSSDVKYYLASLDIPVMDAFGMSETSGVHTLNASSAFRFESSGRSIPGAKTKIVNPDPDGHGEICMFGRNLFMGYVDDKDQTDTTVDKDGWLHSGDIGKLDKGGFLYISGRIKELLITAGGENISPILIEQKVKSALPFLGHAMVICERKKFLSLLVTLSCETDPNTGESTDELMPSTKKWLKDLGFPLERLSHVIASGPDEKILASIQKGIDIANSKAISHAQRIQKFAILPKDFSIPSGELGPTLKLKRNVICEKYKHVINKFYET